MVQVPRRRFAPDHEPLSAYANGPLPNGHAIGHPDADESSVAWRRDGQEAKKTWRRQAVSDDDDLFGPPLAHESDTRRHARGDLFFSSRTRRS